MTSSVERDRVEGVWDREARREEARRKEPIRKRTAAKKDVVAELMAQKAIGPAQRRAAEHVRGLFDQACDDGIGAMDPSKVIVDGGGAALDFHEIRLLPSLALKELRKLVVLLGDERSAILMRAVVERESLQSIAFSLEEDEKQLAVGNASRRTRDYVSRSLRSALASVARECGYARKANKNAESKIVSLILEGARPTDRPDVRIANGGLTVDHLQS